MHQIYLRVECITEFSSKAVGSVLKELEYRKYNVPPSFRDVGAWEWGNPHGLHVKTPKFQENSWGTGGCWG